MRDHLSLVRKSQTIITYLNDIRPCRVIVAEKPEVQLDLSKPFFEQLPKRIYYLCVETLPK